MPKSAETPGTRRNLLRQTLALLLLAAIPALISACIHRDLFTPPPLAPGETTWTQVAAWQRDPASSPRILLLDARTGDAYATAHAPGALNLNPAHWEQQLPLVIDALGRAPETRIVVYCDDALCDTSRAVAARLRRELALTDIYVLKGGWRSR